MSSESPDSFSAAIRELGSGPPIDSNRLFWFIRRHREGQAPDYLRALDDLERWLRDGGYENPQVG